MSVRRVEDLIADGLFEQAHGLLSNQDGFAYQLLRSRLSIDQGKISETISTLDVISPQLNRHSNLYLEFLILRSDVHLYHGDISGGIEMGLEILGKIAENYFLDDSEFDMEDQHNRLLFILAALHMDKGEDVKALNYIELIKPRNMVDKSKILNNKGIIKFNLNQYEEARRYFEKALLSDETELPKRHKLSILNNQAMIKHAFGDMDAALEQYLECKNLVETIECESDRSMILNNIAEIYSERGELDIALAYYEQCLEIDRVASPDLYIAFSLDNIAEIHKKKGEFDIAKSLHYESNLTYLRMENYSEVALNYLNLLEIEILNSNYEEALLLFGKLKKLRDDHLDNTKIQIYEKIGNGLILKSGDRAYQKFSSQVIFEELSQMDELDQNWKVKSLLNLCEILLDELRLYNNPKVIQELEEISTEIELLARQQTSYILTIEIHLLQSKLALLNLEVQKSKNLLERAYQIASDKGLRILTKKISTEIDELLDKLSVWSKLSSMDSTLRERIELSGLDKTIESLITNAFIKEIEVENEKPVAFLILDRSGSSRYKYAFETEITIHSQLIGALISALNLLSAEIFEKEGNLERIKHEKYSIVIQTVDTFMFCYIFDGNSYFAVEKLKKLVDKIQENQILWDLLLDRITVIPEENPDMKLIVENYLVRFP